MKQIEFLNHLLMEPIEFLLCLFVKPEKLVDGLVVGYCDVSNCCDLAVQPFQFGVERHRVRRQNIQFQADPVQYFPSLFEFGVSLRLMLKRSRLLFKHKLHRSFHLLKSHCGRLLSIN
ncbi:MAG: hypothetical protein JMDDDDMK_02421 [Acidobacteria bacterium]|nr:hypothetical protein [Acidobacteriota bacterium]